MPLRVTNMQSTATGFAYKRDADSFMRLFFKERYDELNAYPCDINDWPKEELFCAGVRFFLEQNGRWSAVHIRRIALGLQPMLDTVVALDSVPDAECLLKALQNPSSRPQPAAGKQRRYRKSVKNSELRRLINHLRHGDEFSVWIAGYIIIATRLGWRPSEIISIWREGHFVRSVAAKHTNSRGLCDFCEIDISAYPSRFMAHLDHWIDETKTWLTKYRSLLDAINGRLRLACKSLGLRRICTYTFRNFAIACAKASGFSVTEIAVLINHASNRTASEGYGKRRSGFKRAKKMLRYQAPRLSLVRDRFRSFERVLHKRRSLSLN
jgi:hypothetical protein